MGTLKVYQCVTVTIDGRTTHQNPDRDTWTPKKEVTVSNVAGNRRTFTVPKRTPSSPQPEPTVLWEWTEEQGFFAYLEIEVDSGSVIASWKVDSATSDDDLSPAGTHEKTNEVVVSDYCAFPLPSSSARVNAVLADAAGLDGDGFPSNLTDEGSGSGYVYKLWCINPSTTDDVLVTVYTKG